MEETPKIPLPATLGLSSNPLAHKLNQILSTSFLDADIKAAIDALERRRPGNEPEDGQSLGTDISLQILENNMAVLRDYKQLAEGMRSTKIDMQAMRQAIDQMKTESETVKASSSQLIMQASFLKQQRARVHEKRAVLLAFQRKFMISDEQLLRLSSSEPVDDDFFAALERVKCIHDDCHLLLATDRQSAGKDIMDAMSQHLDTGYAKLHRWILRELGSTVSGAAEANVTLRHALMILSERATLFEQCLEHVSRSRQRILANEFSQALNRGREGGRPMLAASDDPMRFVNDVLAYLHQAVASEKEVLDVILGSANNAPTETEQARRTSAAQLLSPPALEDLSFNFANVHSSLVDRNFQLVMKPLQQHIDQVVMSTQDTLAAYRSAILIRFYRDLLARVLLPEAQVLTSLKALEKSLTHWFLQFTRTDLAAVKVALPSADVHTLQPPGFLKDAMNDTADVLNVLDGSFLDTASKQADFTEMFDTILKQALELCVRMAADLEQPAASIFLLHCATAVTKTLKPHEHVAESQLLAAQEIADRSRQAIVVEQHEFLLRQTGMARYLESFEADKTEDTDTDTDRLLVATKKASLRRELASRQDLFSQAALSSFDETLGAFLPRASAQLSERLSKLDVNDAALFSVDAINNEALTRYVRNYEFLEVQVVDYIEFGRSLLGKSQSEVREALHLPWRISDSHKIETIIR
ncbi:oligomeric Golgi complex subunit 6 [Protomyces lactucae-debilis]|uniref:Conserved oligomeric Golgi complex subunit 6 n=1 Tax=Protomyces lactucae-debilis TaxID=2754530 RepID=A0A1Y2F7F9_PROLT|nr:oligomeric Golgi complex subunit 6 [Protomyces lactucae-debilis]ORY79424.1 oligomeric Golgi complex subunit 6 [Protomyces lactucae-debilis]